MPGVSASRVSGRRWWRMCGRTVITSTGGRGRARLWSGGWGEALKLRQMLWNDYGRARHSVAVLWHPGAILVIDIQTAWLF